jgi:glycosyltransferase involved in cell wall biosynthesis
MTVYVQHFQYSTNPTHHLLHKAMARRGMRLRYFVFCFFPIRPTIIYIHFPEECLTTPSTWKMLIKTSVFIFSICSAKLGGSKIVWEVNNLRTHDRYHSFFEKLLMVFLTRSLTGLIHYSKSSSLESINTFPILKRVRSTIIPHPNFHHVYPAPGDKTRGCQILGVNQCETVLLGFGMIRRYKNLGKLVELFKRLEEADLRLVIAGEPIDRAYADELQRAVVSDSRIRLILQQIAHEDVPHIFAAATLFCAPYRAILNSGSILLALSCACPVIAPRMGSLPDLEERVGADWLLLYRDEIDLPILRNAIAWASRSRCSEPGLAFCDIEQVTTQTIAFLKQVRSS